MFFEQVMNGLTIGAIYILLASGLTIVFGLQGIVNVAHGIFYMLGAYLAIDFYPHLGLPLTIVTVFAAVAGLGLIVERTAVRPLVDARRDTVQVLIVTLGVAIIASEVTKIVWGPVPRLSEVPSALRGSTQFLGLTYPVYWLFVIVFTAALMAALGLAFNFTTLGVMVQATALDAETAQVMGINVPALNSIVFGLGAGVAGVAGVLAGPILSVYPTMCFDLLMILFVIVILGGLGSLLGVVVSGLLVGWVNAFGVAYLNGTTGTIAVFAVMIAVLVVRPLGLLGRPGILD
jgi:branched-subunit amino acid ABC-type transport system permease component